MNRNVPQFCDGHKKEILIRSDIEIISAWNKALCKKTTFIEECCFNLKMAYSAKYQPLLEDKIFSLV